MLQLAVGTASHCFLVHLHYFFSLKDARELHIFVLRRREKSNYNNIIPPWTRVRCVTEEIKKRRPYRNKKNSKDLTEQTNQTSRPQSYQGPGLPAPWLQPVAKDEIHP